MVNLANSWTISESLVGTREFTKVKLLRVPSRELCSSSGSHFCVIFMSSVKDSRFFAISLFRNHHLRVWISSTIISYAQFSVYHLATPSHCWGSPTGAHLTGKSLPKQKVITTCAGVGPGGESWCGGKALPSRYLCIVIRVSTSSCT